MQGDRKAPACADSVDADSVVSIRTRLKLSQSEFADAFGIIIATLRN